MGYRKKASHTNIFSISPNESYDEVMGNSEFLEDKHGLSVHKINERIKDIINYLQDVYMKKLDNFSQERAENISAIEKDDSLS